MYTMGVTNIANYKYPVHCRSRCFVMHDLSYIYQCCGFMDSWIHSHLSVYSLWIVLNSWSLPRGLI